MSNMSPARRRQGSSSECAAESRVNRMDPRQPPLASFLDLDELLRRVAWYASESIGTEASAILLHDTEAHEFVVARRPARQES